MSRSKRFWVVGGEYADMSFSKLVEGTHRVSGPFPCPRDAVDAWRSLAFASTAAANVRFSIVEEPSG